MNATPKITPQRIRALEMAEAKLHALEGAGVDNWGGYDDAMEPIREEAKRQDTASAICDEIIDIIGEHVEEPAGRRCGYGIRLEGQERLLEFILTSPLLKIQVLT